MDIFYSYSVVDLDNGITSGSEWHPTPLVTPAVGSQFEFLNGPTVIAGYVHSVATVVEVVRDATGSVRTRQNIIQIIRVSQTLP